LRIIFLPQFIEVSPLSVRIQSAIDSALSHEH
jgi:hypothetical protein